MSEEHASTQDSAAGVSETASDNDQVPDTRRPPPGPSSTRRKQPVVEISPTAMNVVPVAALDSDEAALQGSQPVAVVISKIPEPMMTNGVSQERDSEQTATLELETLSADSSKLVKNINVNEVHESSEILREQIVKSGERSQPHSHDDQLSKNGSSSKSAEVEQTSATEVRGQPGKLRNSSS
jgi:hypothetical protein